MLKKIFTLLLSAGLFAAIGVSSNSCAPTAPSDTSATVLRSSPTSLPLDTTHLTASSDIGLSCGCPFLLTVTGYGGDTSIIHFSFGERLDTSITTHHISATIIPSLLTGPDTDSAWISLSTPNDSVTPSNPGTELYDTLRVTAIY